MIINIDFIIIQCVHTFLRTPCLWRSLGIFQMLWNRAFLKGERGVREEGERRPLPVGVWLTSNHSNCSPSIFQNSCAFLFLSAQILILVHRSLLESRKVDHPKPPSLGHWIPRRGKEEKKAWEGKEVKKEGKGKGRRVDKRKRSRGGIAQPRLILCPLTSYLTSGSSQNLLLETAFLTHFSLGFLLFMMKSYVKETKIETKVCFAIPTLILTLISNVRSRA